MARDKETPDLTFTNLQAEAHAWRLRNFPETATNADMQFLGVAEEVGELAHARLKGLQKIRGKSPADYFKDEQDAVGDIIIYLAGYCSARGISMQVAVELAWDQVRHRDWITYPKDGRTQ